MKRIYLLMSVLSILASSTIAQLQPAGDAIVSLDWNNGRHSYSNSTMADANGYYEMNVASGNVSLSARMEFHRGSETLKIGNWSGNFFINGTEWRNFTLFMPVENTKIYGYVYDNESHAALHANVSIHFEAFDKKYSGLNYTLTKNGYYEIWLPASNVSIIASANGYNIASCNFNISQGEERRIDFYLDAMPTAPLNAWIKGYVEGNGQPINNASVGVDIHNDSYNYTFTNFTFTSSNGYFEFKVPSGEGRITVNAIGFFPYIGNISTKEGATTWINITLNPLPPNNAWVSGYIYDNEGNPVAGANVSIRGTILKYTQTGYFEKWKITDGSGYYNISVPSGTPPTIISMIDFVYANKDGYFDNSTILYPPSNVIQPGQTLNVNVMLDKMPLENCKVKGYIYLALSKIKHILYVGGTGPNNYSSIQDAINDASNGDIIKVYPGTYKPIIINKEIKLIGDPTIDGHGNIGIKIEANNVSIENFTIFNFSTGIYVHNNSFTIKNVSIYNCTIYNPSKHGAGIKFDHVIESKITGVEINNTWDGISIYYSSYNIIDNCTSHNNGASGIFLFSSSYNDVLYNLLAGNRDGIYIDHSAGKENTIVKNNIKNNIRYGIIITYSSNNHVYLNNFINNNNNVYATSTNTWQSPTQVSYTYNGTNYANYLGNYWDDYKGNDTDNDGIGDISYRGIDLYPLMQRWENYFRNGRVYNVNKDAWYDTIQDAINDASNGDIIKVYPGVYKPIIINKEIKLIGDPTIDGHGGYGIKIEANNVSIENFTIFNCSTGIYVYTYPHTITNVSIKKCIIHSCSQHGMEFKNVNDILISGNNIYNCSKHGLRIWYGENLNIISNTIFNNIWDGIFFDAQSNNNVIMLNKIYNNLNDGIEIYTSLNDSIIANEVFNSSRGIHLYSSRFNNISENYLHNNNYGIYLISNSANNTIYSNTIYNNSNDGIRIYSNNNNISFNEIYNNEKYGILISSGSNNTLYGNYIYSNGWDGVSLSTHSSNNAILYNHIFNNSYDGIKLYYYTSNNTIKYNYIYNNSNGIRISYKNHNGNAIEQNYIYKNRNNGIYSDAYTTNTIIANNEIYENGEKGIFFLHAINNIIENNTCYNNKWGIVLQDNANNNTVSFNRAFNNSYSGITIWNANNNNISFNEIYNNSLWGIQLKQAQNNIIMFNKVYNHTAEWNSAGIVAFSLSNYNNISSNLVYNNRIDNIELWNNSFYNIIWNNTVHGAEYGILLSRNANDNTIAKNTIYGNEYGIGLGHGNTTWGGSANNNTIISNTIVSNQYGIYLFKSMNNNISNSSLYNNDYAGIGIYNSSDDVVNGCFLNNGIAVKNCFNISILNCTCYDGVPESHGIVVGYSNNTLIGNCNIKNTTYGIALYFSSNSTIFNCNISGNYYGIYLNSSNNNLIYNNYFNNTINAWDDGNNKWNVSKMAGSNIIGGGWLGGNYWHDYEGSDINGDGLGDTMLPYNCNGNIINGGDMLPLVSPLNDTIPPRIERISYMPKYHVGLVNITCIVNDNIAISEVWINITFPNGSTIKERMIYSNGIYYYNSSFNLTGNYSFHIYALDENGNENISTTMKFEIYPKWDLDMNHRINILDLIIVAMHFGSHEGEEGYSKKADLNNDGKINIIDLIIVAMHWTG